MSSSTEISGLTASSASDPLKLAVDEEKAKIYQGNCLVAPTVITRGKVALIVTSPPYPGVNQPEAEYVTFPDPLDFNASHDFLQEVWAVCYDLLEDLGRLVVNIYDIPTGTGGMIPNVPAVIKRCLEVGFVLREEYVWDKMAGYSPPSGSWPFPKGVLSANTFELVLVFQKPLAFSQRRVDPSSIPEKTKKLSELGPVEHEWLMNSVWRISADRSGRSLGHPFTFPEDLIERLIKLYTFVGETVLDPFVGSGTTVLVAEKLDRLGIGFELSEKYINICKGRFGQRGLFG